MSNHDQLHRYLFENYAVRGELVTVSETYQQILNNHDYPAPVQKLLGELLVATSLLTATLKFDGDITVQLQGDGPLKLAVINGNNRQEMRGVARTRAPIADDSTLHQMIGNGVMVITISPTEGERYQGVVGLEGETTAECTEAYFRQSEQLPTRLFIRTGEAEGNAAAAGMLLQVLPAQDGNLDDFDHLVQLTNTVKSEELFGLPANEVLYRLYHRGRGHPVRTAGRAVPLHLFAPALRRRAADPADRRSGGHAGAGRQYRHALRLLWQPLCL